MALQHAGRSGLTCNLAWLAHTQDFVHGLNLAALPCARCTLMLSSFWFRCSHIMWKSSSIRRVDYACSELSLRLQTCPNFMLPLKGLQEC